VIAAMETAKLDASVIIVGYNAKQLLPGCLDSILTSKPSPLEVIFIDNASNDGSWAEIQNNFPEVKLSRSETNLGYGGGNNLGTQLATGKTLIFLNPDTIVMPDALEALASTLDENRQTGMVTSKVLSMGFANRINTAGNDIHVSGITLCRGANQPAEAFKQVEQIAAVSGAAFAMRRDFFEYLGGFDQDFFLYMEDTDLSLRCRLAGRDCLYIPNSIVLHDYQLGFGQHKTFYLERNRYQMLLKNFSWQTLLALFPVLVLAEIVAWCFVLLHEPHRARNKLSAYSWIWRNRVRLRSKRLATQALRRRSDRELLRQHGYKLDFRQTGSGWVSQAANLTLTPAFYLLSRLAHYLAARKTW
jgi:GT2 family glycosyltransferase